MMNFIISTFYQQIGFTIHTDLYMQILQTMGICICCWHLAELKHCCVRSLQTPLNWCLVRTKCDSFNSFNCLFLLLWHWNDWYKTWFESQPEKKTKSNKLHSIILMSFCFVFVVFVCVFFFPFSTFLAVFLHYKY